MTFHGILKTLTEWHIHEKVAQWVVHSLRIGRSLDRIPLMHPNLLQMPWWTLGHVSVGWVSQRD